MEETAVKLMFDGEGYELIPESKIGTGPERHVTMEMDSRLFKWILEGPHKAHYNNAEIGGHILYDKDPNTYE